MTNKAITRISLKKAVAVKDDQEERAEVMSPASGTSARSSRYIEYSGPYGVERSFRLIFQDEEITFFADTDDEKAKWWVLWVRSSLMHVDLSCWLSRLEVLRALVGRIPPNPLWAEMVWLRQQELTDQNASAPSTDGRTSPQKLSLQNR